MMITQLPQIQANQPSMEPIILLEMVHPVVIKPGEPLIFPRSTTEIQICHHTPTNYTKIRLVSRNLHLEKAPHKTPRPAEHGLAF